MKTIVKTAMPKWTKAPEAMVALFEGAVARLPQAEIKKMFGYPAAFAAGHMFAGLFQDSMIRRLPDDERARFVKAFGASPFEPMPGRVMREYVVVPREVIETLRTLATSLTKARDYVLLLPPKAEKLSKAGASKGGGKVPAGKVGVAGTGAPARKVVSTTKRSSER